ncbi:MAG: DUF2975 domain-containing protein [Clostridium sp.]|nr:DUF2975 domain-containing protein [Clostridium sp.]
MKNMFFRKILYGISVLALLLTLLGIIILPSLGNWYSRYIGTNVVNIETLVFIYATIIPFLAILLSVIKLSKNLLNDKGFSRDNLKSLKIISIGSLIEFIIYLIGTVFIFRNLVCFVLTCATLMVFMMSYVIKELISNGIELQD